jgi:hypothetical protein
MTHLPPDKGDCFPCSRCGDQVPVAELEQNAERCLKCVAIEIQYLTPLTRREIELVLIGRDRTPEQEQELRAIWAQQNALLSTK